MKNLEKLTNYIENESKFLFHEEYSSIDETSIKVFSDNKNAIDTTNERLKPYFNNLCKSKNKINIYSLKIEKVQKITKNICFNNFDWKQVKHMGGYYFNSIYKDYFISIWANKSHKYFGDNTLKFEELISCKDISIIIKKSHNFYYLYNDNNSHTTLRLVRSLLMRPFLSDGWIYFHTAAIRYKNKAILLCGNSGNGKTSTLLHFLNNKNGELIANDRVFIGVKDNKIKVFGWDSVVTLGVGVLNEYKQLKKYLTNIDDITCNQDLYGYSPKNEYLKLSGLEMKKLKSKGNKLAITHKHLVGLFNKKIVPLEEISAIIHINLEWDCKNKKLIKLINNDDKISVLNDNLLDNISDQLGWIGYPMLNNSKGIFKNIINSVDFYKYKSDFKDMNLTSFLNEVI